MQSPLKIELVSWNTITRLSYKLAEKIATDHYRPDLVIAIARGGYVPARLVCDYLDIYNLTSIRIAHYHSGAHKIEAARLSLPLQLDITGMNILLVDDVDDSGDTLQLALEHLKDFKPAQIKVAVLHHKLTSTITPDYYAKKIIKWRWITYPWAIVEDIQGFVQNLDPKPIDEQAALAYFEITHGIKISKEVMALAYRNIK